MKICSESTQLILIFFLLFRFVKYSLSNSMLIYERIRIWYFQNHTLTLIVLAFQANSKLIEIIVFVINSFGMIQSSIEIWSSLIQIICFWNQLLFSSSFVRCLSFILPLETFSGDWPWWNVACIENYVHDKFCTNNTAKCVCMRLIIKINTNFNIFGFVSAVS